VISNVSWTCTKLCRKTSSSSSIVGHDAGLCVRRKLSSSSLVVWCHQSHVVVFPWSWIWMKETLQSFQMTACTHWLSWEERSTYNEYIIDLKNAGTYELVWRVEQSKLSAQDVLVMAAVTITTTALLPLKVDSRTRTGKMKSAQIKQRKIFSGLSPCLFSWQLYAASDSRPRYDDYRFIIFDRFLLFPLTTTMTRRSERSERCRR
jgi:hypothetical protein